MTTKTKAKSLFQKLAAVQAGCQAVAKDTEGYGYKYETLGAVIGMLQPLLAEEGLCVWHTTANDEALGLVFITTVFDGEGQSVSTQIPIPAASGKNPMQSMGSIMTYARRYNLKSLFNLSAEDDDGRAAESSTYSKPAPKKAAVHPPKASTAEADAALAMIKEATSSAELEKVGDFIRTNVPEEHRANLKAIYAKRVGELV